MYRELEIWQDEEDQDSSKLKHNLLKELADSDDNTGWKPDEMFEYNERMHKIYTTYNEKTLSDKYTTPLPRINSKSKTSRNRFIMASKIAEQIEQQGNGRVTPESSDDDELYEKEKKKRTQRKQQLINGIQRNTRLNKAFMNLCKMSNKSDTKSSSQSNTTETPATISLSSSPTLNETVRPITSSSRNILRTCLSMS